MLVEDHRQVADAMAKAVAEKDLGGFAALLAPDCEIWHNTDDVVQDRATALAAIESAFAAVTENRYTEIRRLSTPNGFVEQHVVSMRMTPGGSELRVPACLVVEMRGRLIRRIDEYLDASIFSR